MCTRAPSTTNRCGRTVAASKYLLKRTRLYPEFGLLTGFCCTPATQSRNVYDEYSMCTRAPSTTNRCGRTAAASKYLPIRARARVFFKFERSLTTHTRAINTYMLFIEGRNIVGRNSGRETAGRQDSGAVCASGKDRTTATSTLPTHQSLHNYKIVDEQQGCRCCGHACLRTRENSKGTIQTKSTAPSQRQTEAAEDTATTVPTRIHPHK